MDVICSYKVDISLSSQFIKQDKPNIILKKTNLYVNDIYAEHLQIFTDGSKNTEKTVSGAKFIPGRNFTIAQRLGKHLSIYAAELTAITYALSNTLLKTRQYDPRRLGMGM